MKRPRRSGRRARACGYTLLELTVASTLASIFTILIGSASSTFFGLMEDLRLRTQNLSNANMVRARMIGDVRRAASVVCSDAHTVQFTFDGGEQSEYTESGNKVVAWQSVHDRHVVVVEPAVSVDCGDLGDEGLEFVVTLGDSQHPFYVYLHVAQIPEDEGGEG